MKDSLAPDATPSTPSAIRGEVDPVDPAVFGALAPVAPAPAAQAQAAILARLARIGASRVAVESALSSLSRSPTAGKTIEDLGAVVAGVNDSPPEGDAFAGETASIDGSGSAASVPLSPAMLADEKAREAKYGMGAPAGAEASAGAASAAQTASAAAQPTASGRPRIFDASEGTRLDPLLNKTYDLSYAKVVPTVRQ